MYNKHKDNELQQQLAAQSAATVQPDLPYELTSHTKQGVVFGAWNGQYLVKPDSADGHVMIVGGSGSGAVACIQNPFG